MRDLHQGKQERIARGLKHEWKYFEDGLDADEGQLDWAAALVGLRRRSESQERGHVRATRASMYLLLVSVWTVTG